MENLICDTRKSVANLFCLSHSHIILIFVVYHHGRICKILFSFSTVSQQLSRCHCQDGSFSVLSSARSWDSRFWGIFWQQLVFFHVNLKHFSARRDYCFIFAKPWFCIFCAHSFFFFGICCAFYESGKLFVGISSNPPKSVYYHLLASTRDKYINKSCFFRQTNTRRKFHFRPCARDFHHWTVCERMNSKWAVI